MHGPQVRTPRSRVQSLTEAAALALGGAAPSAAAFRRQRDALAAAAFAECAAAARLHVHALCPGCCAGRSHGRCLVELHAHPTQMHQQEQLVEQGVG